jgi:Uma2 family endonuclease
MATTVAVPVSEYLSSSYEVDCDYVDGELQERNFGEWQHGYLQPLLGRIFGNQRRGWQINAATELRVQVAAQRYRIPDVTIMRSSVNVERIVRTAPLICIEVLSPEDRWNRIRERVKDYQHMGVEHVWIFDPFTHDVWIAQPDGTQQHVSDALTVPGTPICIDLAEVWAELDEMQSPR